MPAGGEVYRQEVLVKRGGLANVVQHGDQHIYHERPAYQIEGFPLAMPPPDSAWLLELPSRLLDARSQVVDFTGRNQEIHELSEWRDASHADLSVRLLHGPGGQGKTRLATRFAELSDRAGWTVVQARYDATSAPMTDNTAGIRAQARGVLMIVDYADRWPHSDLLRLFVDPLIHQGMPARVLLLGRSVQWWPAMRGELAELRAATGDLLLGQLASTPQVRKEVFDAARDQFAELLGVDNTDRIRPPGALDDASYGLVLALHMAALVAVDACSRGQRPPTDPEALAAYLLDREYMNWRRLYDSRVHGEEFQTPPSVMARTVFTAVLTGPARYTMGGTVLKNLELEPPQRILTDHRVCYPPTDRATVLEPLYPDRLAEDFLGLLLPGHNVTGYDPDPWASDAPTRLLTRDTNSKPPTFAPRTITVLAAAATRWPHAAERLNAILAADPALAVDAGSAALTALADAPTVDDAVLGAIEECFPEHRHVNLDPGIAAVTARLTPSWLAATTDLAEHARLHAHLGYRLANAGFIEEALGATEQAVQLCRELAAISPAEFEPELAAWLHNLGVDLSRMGRRNEALAAAEESVQILRRSAAASPAEFELELAASLHNLGNRMSDMGRLEDALAATEEAVQIRRRLAAIDPAAFELALAASLHNLAIRLWAMGQPQDAVAPAEEAVETYRRLAAGSPSEHEPELAASLNNLGVWLLVLGRPQDALALTEEAVQIRRRLAATSTAVFQPDLATSLCNLGNQLSALGRLQEALAATEEAVQVHRRLAAINPAAFEPALAASLNGVGRRLSALGRRKDALAATQQAVEIRRRLAAISPAAFDSELAGSLNTLAGRLSAVGRREEALAAAQQAVEINRQLATASPAAYETELAASLNNLSIQLSAIGRLRDSLAATQEAVEIYRRWAAASPAAFDPNLAIALNNLSIDLSNMESTKDALAATEQAVEINQRLAAANPATSEPQLASSLDSLGRRLSAVGRVQDALLVTQQAVEIYRRLATASPTAFEPVLATSLTNLGNRLSALGRPQEALVVTEHAVEIFRRLAAGADLAEFETDLTTALANLTELRSILRKGAEQAHQASNPPRPQRDPSLDIS